MKKIIFSSVIIEKSTFEKLVNEFHKEGFEIVCVITNWDWIPIVNMVLPNVKCYWLDNFLAPEIWDFPLTENSDLFFMKNSAMPIALAERSNGFYGVIESETRLLFQASMAEHIIYSFNPDLFVSWGSVERTLDYSLFQICKNAGIPILMTKNAGFKRLVACTTDYAAPILNIDGTPHSSIIPVNNFSDSANSYLFIEKVIKELRNGTANFFQSAESIKGNRDVSKPKFSIVKFLVDKFIANGLKRGLKEIFVNGLWESNLYYKRILYNKYFEKGLKFTYNENLSYIYFPLQWQPELSSMPIGMEFYNQIRAIKLISESTDESTIIWVKEHPTTFSAKSTINRRFKNKFLYEWLAIIPKVQLIPINTPTETIIGHSKAVSTVNGSIASEAFVLKKPVLVFSDNFLINAPGVFRVNCKADIKNAISQLGQVVITDEIVDTFIYNLCKNTWCMKQDDLSDIIYNDVIVPEITELLIRGFKNYCDKTKNEAITK